MCYSALVKRDLEYLERRYGAIVIPQDLEDYLRASAEDPQHFPPLGDRIYPGHYAPVLFRRDGQRVIEWMRYGVYPPAFVRDGKRYTSFNARRDNLTSKFWSEAYGKHHGFLILAGFYEWVEVKDLLQAGVVTLNEVKAEFARQAEERRARLEAQGKKYRPTPTEKKDPRFRKIIIEFRPQQAEQDLIVPAIFSYRKLDHGKVEKGFAIVTDEPPLDIAAAGHDRCPILLQPDVLDLWLQPKGQSPRQLDELFEHQLKLNFMHALPSSA